MPSTIDCCSILMMILLQLSTLQHCFFRKETNENYDQKEYLKDRTFFSECECMYYRSGSYARIQPWILGTKDFLHDEFLGCYR